MNIHTPFDTIINSEWGWYSQWMLNTLGKWCDISDIRYALSHRIETEDFVQTLQATDFPFFKNAMLFGNFSKNNSDFTALMRGLLDNSEPEGAEYAHISTEFLPSLSVAT